MGGKSGKVGEEGSGGGGGNKWVKGGEKKDCVKECNRL